MIEKVIELACDPSRRGAFRLSKILCSWGRRRIAAKRPHCLTTEPRVVHVCHNYFGDESCVGGAERYATELATAMARSTPVQLFSFGAVRHTLDLHGLSVDIFPSRPPPAGSMAYPATTDFTHALRWADVIHVHHYHTRLTALCVLYGAMKGISVFVTDCGGWEQVLYEQFDYEHLLTGLLGLSRYSLGQLPSHSRSRVIYGGVNEQFLATGGLDRETNLIACVARIMPHKGINVLIKALDKDMRLECYGRPYRSDYFELLHSLAVGKQVAFLTDSDDATVAAAYRRAVVTVLPSVHQDIYGQKSRIPELLGLVLLESMASGTPVICSDAGALPEIVEDGVTGYIVPWGDVESLRKRLRQLCDHPELAARMGAEGRSRVLQHFTWPKVVERCLAAYRELAL